MTDKIKSRSDADAWQNKYDPNAPGAGEDAVDFELSDVKGENSIKLSDYFEQKPIALIFGSFT